MNLERLMESVKQHEGYRNKVYLDTLGKRTVGVGHLCTEDWWEDDKEYEEEFLMKILEEDLQEAIEGASTLMLQHDCSDIDEKAHEIIIEMVFQLGMTGVSKFKKCGKLYQHTIIQVLVMRCLIQNGLNKLQIEQNQWQN